MLTQKHKLKYGMAQGSYIAGSELDTLTKYVDDQLLSPYGVDDANTFKRTLKLHDVPPMPFPPNASCLVFSDHLGNVGYTENASFPTNVHPLYKIETNDVEITSIVDVRVWNYARHYETVATKFNERSGNVLPFYADFSASQIASMATNLQTALTQIAFGVGSYTGIVRKLYGRPGPISAQVNDYYASQIPITFTAFLGNEVTECQSALYQLASTLSRAVSAFKSRKGLVSPTLGDYRANMVPIEPINGCPAVSTQDGFEYLARTIATLREHSGVSSLFNRQGSIRPSVGDVSADMLSMVSPVLDKTNVQDVIAAVLSYLNTGGEPMIVSNLNPFYSLPADTPLDIATKIEAIGGAGALTITVEPGSTAAGAVITQGVLHTSISTYGLQTIVLKVTDAATSSSTKSFSFTSTSLDVSNLVSNLISVPFGSSDIAYSLTGTGGVAPYRFEVVKTDLPGCPIGATTDAKLHSNGLHNGEFYTTVKIVDASNVVVSKTLSFSIEMLGVFALACPASNVYDGLGQSYAINSKLWRRVCKITVKNKPASGSIFFNFSQTSGPSIAGNSITTITLGPDTYIYMSEEALITPKASYSFSLSADCSAQSTYPITFNVSDTR